MAPTTDGLTLQPPAGREYAEAAFAVRAYLRGATRVGAGRDPRGWTSWGTLAHRPTQGHENPIPLLASVVLGQIWAYARR